jgi:SAM-dependent methyltransferase
VDQGMSAARYFDSDYYQAGHKKGTHYSEYLEHALSSSIYRSMAAAIALVFRPARVLEIGCAAGPIVKQLSDMGIEAHGIDVSEWAVQNRFHANVIRASVDDLPFDDNAFDLVFSCHALEHLPDSIVDGAFAEMSRVGARHQFHMMPIIGIPPYDGPVESALTALRSDPTHNLLHDRAWWLERWSRQGWHGVPVNVLLDADNSFFEFSTCQVILSNSVFDSELLKSVQDFNLSFFKRVSLWDLHRSADAGKRAQPQLSVATTEKPHTLALRKGVWGELAHHFSEPSDLRDATLFLLCRVDAAAPLNLRVAAVSFKDGAVSGACDPAGIAGVAQRSVELPAGYTAFALPLNELSPLYGSPRPESIGMLMFGGESPFAASVECVCELRSASGVQPLSLRPYSSLGARLGRYVRKRYPRCLPHLIQASVIWPIRPRSEGSTGTSPVRDRRAANQ